MKKFCLAAVAAAAAAGSFAELVPIAPAGGETVPMLSREQIEVSRLETYKERLDYLKPEYLEFLVTMLSIPLLISIIRAAIDGDWARAWDDSIKIWLIVLAVFAVIIYIGYLLVVWMYGGKYVVHFTLDEDQLVHEQEAAQFQRARKLGLAAILVGIFSKRPATVGQGIFIASKNTSTSTLAKVRRIKPRRAWHLIKVNEGLEHNQIYVPKEDYDLVLDFLRQHCPNAK